ncbi:HNH endonuclease [Thalassotalea maritima]|uniref:HNH endonuclease n=1 Tax=Thalassotalea maritima TaxID=3242416 RepID=UPI0035273088
MAAVTFIVGGKSRRQNYVDVKRAYTGIYKWLIKHANAPQKQAILYSQDSGTESFVDAEQVPYRPKLVTPSFYLTAPWLELRQQAMERDEFCCVRCGASRREDGAKLEVDHIKERATHPELTLN